MIRMGPDLPEDGSMSANIETNEILISWVDSSLIDSGFVCCAEYLCFNAITHGKKYLSPLDKISRRKIFVVFWSSNFRQKLFLTSWRIIISSSFVHFFAGGGHARFGTYRRWTWKIIILNWFNWEWRFTNCKIEAVIILVQFDVVFRGFVAKFPKKTPPCLLLQYQILKSWFFADWKPLFYGWSHLPAIRNLGYSAIIVQRCQ